MARERFDSFMQASAGEPPFIPYGEVLAERVVSVDRDVMRKDPAEWGAAVVKTAQLVGADAIVAGFDFRLAVTAVKTDGDNAKNNPLFATLSETIGRLAQTERRRFGVIAMITGPATLARQSGASDMAEIKTAAISLVEDLCQKRPDLVIVMEDASLGQATIGNDHRKAYNALKNVASYFDVPLALYLEDYNPAGLEELAKLRLSGLFFGPDGNGEPPAVETALKAVQSIGPVGIPIDVSDLAKAKEMAAAYAGALGGKTFAFTSMKAIDTNVDLEGLLELSNYLHVPRIG